ncbi:alpha-xenorhabdolysin family binary toxin subunit B [Pseudomonas asiatica]|uniref:alpha-xenorhabdolysin family binary toxin subunit B n=1 Tax=Pseudomonas asiatica TaxID=2219225 RepID=UPI00383ABDBB
MEAKVDNLPDIKVMLTSEARMAELYYANMNGMLPSLRERLLDLTKLLKAGNDCMRENVLSSLVALNLELDSSTAVLDEEDLLRLRQSLQADMENIAKAVERVSAYRTPDVKGLRRDQDEVVAKLGASATQLEQTVAAQQKRVAEVDGLLDTLDHPSVRDALRNVIPQEQDIDSLFATFKDPSVTPELVKGALVKLNTHLDLLEQGRKFADVVAARERLSSNLNQQKQGLRTVQRQLEEAQEKSGQFDQVEQLLGEREPWLEQMSKFVRHWQMLSNLMDASAQLAELQAALEKARDYMVALRRRFEAA